MGQLKPWMRWVIAAAVLLLFVLVWFLIDRSSAIDGTSRVVLGVGLILLGLVAAIAIVWYLRPREVMTPDAGDDVLLTIASARRLVPRGDFNRPMVLVLGSEGSAKTSLVARSGGDPELVAGVSPASASEAPVPTKTVNMWAMQPAVITELGGSLLNDGPRWTRVIRALRAPRVAAAFGKGTAAARSAVVCVPCDLFYAGGSGQQLEELSRVLRQRLAEASRELGLALPVYVVFTRMDKLPQFESWVSVFTKDELRAPLGATLPFDAASTAANYAERLTPRIELAFRRIVDVISARRVDLLARESVRDRRYGAYELPRELSKVITPVTSFLVELCRPTQLGSSPLLRGFYFVGARPVVLTDVARAQQARVPAPSAANATLIFRDGAMGAPPPAADVSVTRKVPEWVFLDRFLRDVVLADSGAASVARGGVRVERTRRMAFGAAIAAGLLLAAGITISWLRNNALTNRVGDAARAVAALPVVQSTPGTIAFPSRDALSRLDALRAQLDTLRGYKRDGVPITMRLGLWKGEQLFNAARPAWYEGYRSQLHATARGAIVDSLRALPEAPRPSDDRDTAYGWLRTYLITTSEPQRSTADLVTPVLLKSWQRGQETDADITALATRQFDFYASELPTHNPWPEDADAKRVGAARNFLGRFTAGDQIYPNMIAAANKATPAIAIPQGPGVVTSQPEVTGAFTPKGDTLMADRFRNFESYQGEPWVVGDASAAQSGDRDAIIRDLRARYLNDYILAWRKVLQSTVVVRPANLKDAANKLERINSPTSPLLAVLRTVAVNTNSDSVRILAFQPVHAVTPANVLDKFISEKNQPYIDALSGLQLAIQGVDNMPKETDTASVTALVQSARAVTNKEVAEAERAEKRLAATFQTTPQAADASASVQRILLAPISGAELVLAGVARTRPRVAVVAPKPVAAEPAAAPAASPALAALNARGAAMCRDLAAILRKYPFNPDATADASLDDVATVFAPATGTLWAYYQNDFKDYLPKQGEKWVAKPVKNVTLTPAFEEFFNHLARVTTVLFADGGPTPRLRLHAKAATSAQTPLVTLSHGGFASDFNSRTPLNVVDWPAAAAGGAKLDARFGTEKTAPVTAGTGEWAIFRMVSKGAAEAAGRTLRVTWPATSAKKSIPVLVSFEPLDSPNGALSLGRGWFSGPACPQPAAQ